MSEASYRRFVLSHLHMAGLRARYMVSVSRALWKAVKLGTIDPDTAMALLDDAHGIDLIVPEWDGRVPVPPPAWAIKHLPKE